MDTAISLIHSYVDSPDAKVLARIAKDVSALPAVAHLLTTPGDLTAFSGDSRDIISSLIEVLEITAERQPAEAIQLSLHYEHTEPLVAAYLAAAVNGPEASPVLERLAQSHDPFARWIAVTALGHHRGPSVTQALLVASADDDQLVSVAAKESLARMAAEGNSSSR
jgi:HEAT repeat protein